MNEVDLRGAHLSAVNLRSADLSETNLIRAQGVNNEELAQQAEALAGATLPDGQKYEEWRKDNEGGGEVGKNPSYE